MQKFMEKVQNSKGFISLDTVVTGAIVIALGVAILVIFNAKGGAIASDSNTKLNTATTANKTGITTSVVVANPVTP